MCKRLTISVGISKVLAGTRGNFGWIRGSIIDELSGSKQLNRWVLDFVNFLTSIIIDRVD